MKKTNRKKTPATAGVQHHGLKKGLPNLKKVTFLVPSHIADLIDETRDLVDNPWEHWLINLLKQSCGGAINKPFESCVIEFCSLMMDDGVDASTRRLNKLLPPLRKAFDREMALREAVAPEHRKRGTK